MLTKVMVADFVGMTMYVRHKELKKVLMVVVGMMFDNFVDLLDVSILREARHSKYGRSWMEGIGLVACFTILYFYEMWSLNVEYMCQLERSETNILCRMWNVGMHV